MLVLDEGAKPLVPPGGKEMTGFNAGTKSRTLFRQYPPFLIADS